MKNMMGMMKQAQKLQAKMVEMQAELGNRTVSAQAGGGMDLEAAHGRRDRPDFLACRHGETPPEHRLAFHLQQGQPAGRAQQDAYGEFPVAGLAGSGGGAPASALDNFGARPAKGGGRKPAASAAA